MLGQQFVTLFRGEEHGYIAAVLKQDKKIDR